MARIVVAGYMVRYPFVGNVFTYLHYVIGLARLGCDVTYVEHTGWPGSCYNPATGAWGELPGAGLRLVRELLARWGVNVAVCWVDDDTGAVDGLTRNQLEGRLREADLLLNVGGVCWLPEFDLCPVRALVDCDPFFTQAGMFGSDILHTYHAHFSYGANIGRGSCRIPLRGIDWIPTIPPVVPDLWRADSPPDDAPCTTVGNWTAYGGVDHEGEHFGQKDEEFVRLLDIPGRVTRRLELALAAPDAIVERFRRSGWTVREAREVSTDFDTYRSYIAGSWAELSVAKNGYVKSHSGWFSERTVCYLAAGRPAVIQDTGFSEWLPTGYGVIPFSSPEEAIAGLERVESDPITHRRAAVELAESVFGYRVVLPRLIETASAHRPSRSPLPGATGPPVRGQP